MQSCLRTKWSASRFTVQLQHGGGNTAHLRSTCQPGAHCACSRCAPFAPRWLGVGRWVHAGLHWCQEQRRVHRRWRGQGIGGIAVASGITRPMGATGPASALAGRGLHTSRSALDGAPDCHIARPASPSQAPPSLYRLIPASHRCVASSGLRAPAVRSAGVSLCCRRAGPFAHHPPDLRVLPQGKHGVNAPQLRAGGDGARSLPAEPCSGARQEIGAATACVDALLASSAACGV